MSQPVFTGNLAQGFMGRALAIPFSIVFKPGWIDTRTWTTTASALFSHHSTMSHINFTLTSTVVQRGAYWTFHGAKLKSWVLLILDKLAQFKDKPDAERTVFLQQLKTLFPIPPEIERFY